MNKPPSDFLNTTTVGGFLLSAMVLARRMFNIQKLTFRVVDPESERELKELRNEVAELRLKVKTGELERENLSRELKDARQDLADIKQRMEGTT